MEPINLLIPVAVVFVVVQPAKKVVELAYKAESVNCVVAKQMRFVVINLRWLGL
jgi:hypothetical protein